MKKKHFIVVLFIIFLSIILYITINRFFTAHSGVYSGIVTEVSTSYIEICSPSNSEDLTQLSVSPITKISSPMGKLSLSDLNKGDYIEILYLGTIAESYPKQIHFVLKIAVIPNNNSPI